jgi:hypothetical protein
MAFRGSFSQTLPGLLLRRNRRGRDHDGRRGAIGSAGGATAEGAAVTGFAGRDFHGHAIRRRAFRDADLLDQIFLLVDVAGTLPLFATAVAAAGAEQRALREADLRALVSQIPEPQRSPP